MDQHLGPRLGHAEQAASECIAETDFRLPDDVIGDYYAAYQRFGRLLLLLKLLLEQINMLLALISLLLLGHASRQATEAAKNAREGCETGAHG